MGLYNAISHMQLLFGSTLSLTRGPQFWRKNSISVDNQPIVSNRPFNPARLMTRRNTFDGSEDRSGSNPQ
jgi:hypothetical protein